MRLSRRQTHELVGAYALDALDGAERDRFERHLRRCPACERTVRGFAQTATALAMAAAAEPPPGLRERVLTAASVTRQAPPALAGRHGRAATRPGSGVPDRSSGGRSPWVPRVAVAIGAAGMAAAVALGAVQISTQHQLNSAVAREAQIAAVLTAPDARIATAPTSVGGTAVVVVSRTQQKMIFTSSGLPALPSAKVYELWLLGPRSARPAGLLPPPSGGRTAPLLASGVAADDKVGVTVEPAGGTSSPTTTPIVVLTLPA
ncbi:MAG TPA: anti-sigma factor [Trebonia sp.]|nr:anti-sigma factor [Trebonia sp.]